MSDALRYVQRGVYDKAETLRRLCSTSSGSSASQTGTPAQKSKEKRLLGKLLVVRASLASVPWLPHSVLLLELLVSAVPAGLHSGCFGFFDLWACFGLAFGCFWRVFGMRQGLMLLWLLALLVFVGHADWSA